MSATRKNIYAAAPGTTRGKPVHVGGDPKGKNWLYACGSTVYIRNLKNPLECDVYTEHQFPVTVARYAPSGFYIASADTTGTVRIWDTTQKEHILKLELKPISGPILDLQWSGDSKRIVVVGEGKEKFGAVFLWDSGSTVGEISGHSKAITSCDMRQSTPLRIATGSEDFLVCWFEGPPFKFKKSEKEHSRFVNCVRFSPDGSKLVSVSSDKTGILYDGKTGAIVKKLSTNNAHSAGIYSASWSADNKRFVTASADKTAKIWDGESGEVLKTFNFSDNPQTEDQQLGCLWQGDEVVSINLNGDVTYLDLDNPNKPKRVTRGHNKSITALAVDAANNSFYTGSYDALLLKWDFNNGNTDAFNGKGHTNQVARLLVQGDNIVSCAMDDTVRITPLNSREYAAPIGVDAPAADIAVGLKDKNLVIAVTSAAVLVIRNKQVVHKTAVKYQASSVALSADETKVAVGGKDNNVYIYSLSGDKLTETASLKGHRGPLSSIAYSPDGKYLATGDHNRELLIWDASSNAVKANGLVFHTGRINSVAWSPDSKHVVTGGLDGAVYVWDVENSGKRVFIKDAHQGGVNVVAFYDNNTVLSGGQDCNIKSWAITY